MPTKLAKGDTGADVRDLQVQLQSAGYKVERDGWFGEATEAAVRDFQRRSGLVADGIAGPKTLEALKSGQKPGRLLAQSDIAAAADKLGVQVAAVMAVNEVESRGRGFLPGGQPVVLFERHVMYERLAAAGKDAADLALRFPELVNPKRGGYQGGAQEWYRLWLARQIDQNAANESASWGAYQIMGYHWRRLGYTSVASFVAQMSLTEGEHLDAFVRFVLADAGLHKALKARKWADFARGYNGPAYKANLYDVKLQRAYERHAAVEGMAA